MSKNKIIISVVSAIVLILLAIVLVKSPKGDSANQVADSALDVEARMLLLQVRTHILVHQINTESYENVDFSDLPSFEDAQFVVGVISTGSSDEQGYWTGNTDETLIAKAKELCPDCIITSEGFKLIAVAQTESGDFVAKTITHEEDSDVTNLNP